MIPTSTLPADLAGWLDYIEAQHPKSIALGLGRVDEVKRRLKLDPDFPIITVAGTNGKGSTCAMLESIYHEAGYRVACYSSPHLLRYNERVRVDCLEADDAALCAAFLAVEKARNDVQLTYFEFGTLAAMWHFMQTGIDIAIMEVGLGGRLDAVNAFEPNCTIVTSIDMDHMDFLGNSREDIGFEKAGVFRAHIPAICGDLDPPSRLVSHAAAIGADLRLIGRDISISAGSNEWSYSEGNIKFGNLPFPALVGSFQLHNAACCLAAINALQAQLPVNEGQIAAGLRSVLLAGRFQRLNDNPELILDVAHNPHAAHRLAENLLDSPCEGRTLAIFAMLANKDIEGVVAALANLIDAWYVAGIDNVRGAATQQLLEVIERHGSTHAKAFPDVATACRQAFLDAGKNDRIIAFGSFYTVADVMRVMAHNPSESLGLLNAAQPAK